MAREFIVDGRVFPDPDAALTIDQVKARMADFFPGVATSEVNQSKKEDGTEVFEFQKRVGTKG